MSIRRPIRAPVPTEAVEHLRRADPVLREVIDRIGSIELTSEPDLWWSLVDAIMSQQLSVKAASTIIGRLAALGASGRPTPTEILAAEDEALRAVGLSRAKVRYVKDLATRWLDGSLHHARIPEMTDEEVIAELTQVKGIGTWTAEMILIFTLGRPDVLPVDDLAIRVAAQQLRPRGAPRPRRAASHRRAMAAVAHPRLALPLAQRGEDAPRCPRAGAVLINHPRRRSCDGSFRKTAPCNAFSIIPLTRCEFSRCAESPREPGVARLLR